MCTAMIGDDKVSDQMTRASRDDMMHFSMNDWSDSLSRFVQTSEQKVIQTFTEKVLSKLASLRRSNGVMTCDQMLDQLNAFVKRLSKPS